MSDLKKTVLVTGATGLVGRALCRRLRLAGHEVRELSRSSGDYRWNVEAGDLDPAVLEGVDSVVHLAGESVAQRWTPEVKQRILDSRVEGARLLVRRILEMGLNVDFISASGASYYGTCVDGVVDESSPKGDGFLAEVVECWEGAASPLSDAGLRTVFLRTGVVLSADGGALDKLLPVFKAGMGGRVGSGRQRMSWIALSDLVEVFVVAIERDGIRGVLNAVSPEPVSNREFTKQLGRAVGRPTWFPVPALALRGVYGEMADETILSDLEVKPRRLLDAGFVWNSPSLELALAEVVGVKSRL